MQLRRETKPIEIKEGMYIEQYINQVLNCAVRKVKIKKGQLHIWADAYE